MLKELTMRCLSLDEGYREKPYKCSAGKLTIGVGRNLEDKGLSRDEIIYLLNNDYKECEEDIVRTYPWAGNLDEVRLSVLINMRFNLGAIGLSKFKKFLAFMRSGDYKSASLEMLDSRWAIQTGVRAKRLSKMILTGEVDEFYM